MGAILQHLYIVFTASSVVIALLLGVVILRFASHGEAKHYYLEAILIGLALSVCTNSWLNAYSGLIPSLSNFTEPFQLLFGPLLYLYLRRLNGDPAIRRVCLLHFLPFMGVAALLGIFILKHYQSEPLGRSTRTLLIVLSSAAYGQLWVYYLLNIRELRRYRAKLKHTCSDIERVCESWVGHSLVAVLLCYTGISILYAASHHLDYVPINKMLAIIFALLIYIVVYGLLRRPTLFTGAADMPPRYQRSGLKEQGVDDLMIAVRDFMQQNKSYIDPELSLQALADLLGRNAHHLSQAINSENNGNFFDFVNSYRVEEVKSRLLDPQHKGETVLNIALASGFNSKASFNRIFKKHTQQTPSSFRKSTQ